MAFSTAALFFLDDFERAAKTAKARADYPSPRTNSIQRFVNSNNQRRETHKNRCTLTVQALVAPDMEASWLLICFKGH